MGAWGLGISSNDTFADTYAEFFELYHSGLEVEEISRRLITGNQEIINDPDDCNNFWFALAKAKWECKELDKSLYDRVKDIVDTGADIEVWRRLDSDTKDVKKREIILKKFLADLSKEKLKAKARKKKDPKIIQPVFSKGDCLAFSLGNGNFGGAIVLEAIYDTPYGCNLIASTRINQPNKPTLDEYKRATVLVLNYAAWEDSPGIHWYSPIRHKNIENRIQVIGQIRVDKTYSKDNFTLFGSCADFDIWFIGTSDLQFDFELNNKKSSKIIKVKDMTTKSRWKFW